METITYPKHEVTYRTLHVHDYHPIFLQDGRLVFMCDCDDVLSMAQVRAILNGAK